LGGKERTEVIQAWRPGSRTYEAAAATATATCYAYGDGTAYSYADADTCGYGCGCGYGGRLRSDYADGWQHTFTDRHLFIGLITEPAPQYGFGEETDVVLRGV
jgi:hypothetical protein